jgi:uncharacterized membrane protein YkoI
MRTAGTWRFGLVILFTVVGLVTTISADEKKIPLDKVPKAVMDAVKAKYPDGKLTGAEEETEDGKTVYEVALTDNGQKVEATYEPDGTLVSVEKVIPVKDLPKAVTKALNAKYPKANLKRAEEETKGDKVTYEVLLVTADDKTMEVVIDPKGKVLKEEKKETKKEKNKDDN